MPFPSKKRKSAAFVDDDADLDDEVSSKRGKNAPNTGFQSSSKALIDADGNRYWEISKNRRVTISDFKGKKLVNVREYYEKDGEWLPGKKGISMSLEQYCSFIQIMPQIEDLLKSQGENVPRPNYDGSAPTRDEDGIKDEDVDEAMDSKKANIEATSDEED